MPALLTWPEIKTWAWNWARRTAHDDHALPDWMRDVSRLMEGIPEPVAVHYDRALCWTMSAYYEYQTRSWDRERAQKQIEDAKRERMVCDEYLRDRADVASHA